MKGRAALAAALALAGCAAPATRPAPSPVLLPIPEPPPPRPLDELIAAEPGLAQFRALAAAGDLASLIAGRGGVAVLAPADAAFARLAPGTVEALLLPGNRPSLRHLLRFWVVPAPEWQRAGLELATGAATAAVPTLDGEALTLHKVAGEQPRASPTQLSDAAGRDAAITTRTSTEGSMLVSLDRVIAPRSIEPGRTARAE